MIEWIDKYNNLIQITIGLLSLIATIFVSFLIYWLQKRHEIEVEKIEENIRKSFLEEEAHRFLIDNEGEIEYLPWCVFATNLYRHKKHTRKIYTNFCRCSKELQDIILNIAGFSVRSIKDIEWVDKAFDNLRQDIKTYELGNDYLYDNAKYFHRAFEYYRENKWETTPRVFEPINTFKQFARSCYTNGILNINEYIEEYLYHYIGKSGFCLRKPIPPYDFVWESQNLANVDEVEVCRWMLDLVFYTIVNINKYNENDCFILKENITGAQAATFEDRYYETMFMLYFTYIHPENDKLDDIREGKYE